MFAKVQKKANNLMAPLKNISKNQIIVPLLFTAVAVKVLTKVQTSKITEKIINF